VADLWAAFERTVAARGDHPALVAGTLVVSFTAWHRRALDFGRVYGDFGVGPGDRVLLAISNTPDIAAALTAIWARGAIAVLLDAAAPPSHFAHAIATVAPKLQVVAAAAGSPPGLAVPYVDCAEVAAGVGASPPPHRVVPTDAASIVFTSGSTGRPKGVTQSHGNLLRGCRAVAGYIGIEAEDRLLCPVPWSFDYGYGQLLTSITLGVTHITPLPGNPHGICAAIEQHQPTVFAGLAAVYSLLLGGMSPLRGTDLSSLRTLMNTGGAIPRVVLDDLLATFPHSRLYLNYGLTETYRSCYLPAELVNQRADSIGIPIPGADIVIVGEDGMPLEAGQEGEIVHRGDYICLGYWNDPQATARAVRPDPLAPLHAPHAGRALFTGDLGYRDADGFIYFRGRRDHQLKSMGVRVSSSEVEELIYDSGLVSEAAVFGLDHPLLGHEIWAAVVAKQLDGAFQRELERYCRATMSQYMQPRRFLIKTTLPRTTSGKVDYPNLKAAAGVVASGQTE